MLQSSLGGGEMLIIGSKWEFSEIRIDWANLHAALSKFNLN